MGTLLKEAILAGLDKYGLSPSESSEIRRLLSLSNDHLLSVEEIWSLMDRAWEELCCDNRAPSKEALSRFYQHPVWLLNGIFVEHDQVSVNHREAIANWCTDPRRQIKTVLDYGGGFGMLGRMIAHKRPNIRIDIYEPYPSEYVRSASRTFGNVRLIETITGALRYDCVTALDVLEHVVDPLWTLNEMTSVVRTGGYMVLVNNFYPDIKCHLPQNFYLRYSFQAFARSLGLQKVGSCKGSYAEVYQRHDTSPPNWAKIRAKERIFKQTNSLVMGFDLAVKVVKRLFDHPSPSS